MKDDKSVQSEPSRDLAERAQAFCIEHTDIGATTEDVADLVRLLDAVAAEAEARGRADEIAHLRARLAEVEKERDEARADAYAERAVKDGVRETLSAMMQRAERAEAEVERLRAVVEAARRLNHRLGFLPYMTLAEDAGGSHAPAANEVAGANLDLEAALAALDEGEP